MNNKISIGAVIIGRNEGERLISSIKSIKGMTQNIAYVDSASTDNSVVTAKKLGAAVVELDMSVSFTAARARNAGFDYLYDLNPDINYILFVDGDCEVVEEWVETGLEKLESDHNTAIVCGRRSERNPYNSIYNQLCDIEWNTPVGKTDFCGGDFIIRTSVFRSIKGFNPTLIAGEEPEMCLRIIRKGHAIYRLDAEMTLHDANILHFKEWWTRCVRSGYSCAEGAYMYGLDDERYCVVLCLRIWFWSLLLPIFILATSFFSLSFLFLFSIYPLQVMKVALREKTKIKINWKYAFFNMLSKFPEFIGQIKFITDKITKSKSKIIEYKKQS